MLFTRAATYNTLTSGLYVGYTQMVASQTYPYNVGFVMMHPAVSVLTTVIAAVTTT